MQTKHANGAWNVKPTVTELKKFDDVLGILKPLCELSTPCKSDAITASEYLTAVRQYLTTGTVPVKPNPKTDGVETT